VLGVALAVHNIAELSEADGLTVDVEGEGQSSLRATSGTSWCGARGWCTRRRGRPFRGLSVRQWNHIPPGRGPRVERQRVAPGILGANALLGEPLGQDALMDLAVGQEGHPDNLGASLRGGVTITCWDAETRAVVSLPVPDGVEFAVLVPDFEASTAAARAALPASYPRPTPSTTS
jgi:homoserine kinase